MTTKKRSYSRQFKIEAVNLVIEQGYKSSEAARNLGIHPNVLRNWKKQLQTDSSQAFPSKRHILQEREELSRLQKENKRLRMEREILKKATVFFAKESF